MFVPGRLFQPSLMFSSKARAYLFSSIHPRVGSCLTRNHYIRLERPSFEKHSSLLRTFVHYNRKKVLQYCLVSPSPTHLGWNELAPDLPEHYLKIPKIYQISSLWW